MSEEKKFLDLSDDELDAVAGGANGYALEGGDAWAQGQYTVGDVIDFTPYRPEGCKWCGAAPLAGTITGISRMAHTIRVRANCCRREYVLDVDNQRLV